MKRWTYGLLGMGVLIVLPALWQPQGWGSALAQEAAKTKKSAVQSGQASEGQRKFQENCSRCHNAPEGFSPRISGTIVRHMRVRASLSKQDAQDILHFLNP
jgi:cytochrome c2